MSGRRRSRASLTSASAAHRIERATVVETTRWRDSLAALRAGDVDAVIIDEFEAVPFARDADDLRVLPDPAAIESYGLVLRRDDVALRRSLDAALDAMEADGTLAALRAPHHAKPRATPEPYDIAPPPTARNRALASSAKTPMPPRRLPNCTSRGSGPYSCRESGEETLSALVRPMQ